MNETDVIASQCSIFVCLHSAVKGKQVVSIMADTDLNNANVRDILNEIICFCFVSCLNNFVSNLSYEYKNADLALLSSKFKKNRLLVLMSLHEMISLVH